MTSKRFNADRGKDKKGAALRPSDLIDLPESQQKIAQWLMSNAVPSSLWEIAENTNLEQGNTLIDIDELMQRGYVEEIEIAGESRYRIRLASREGIKVPETIVQALTPGKPLSAILNPSGEHSVKSGESFDLRVTITNKGYQSALIEVKIDELTQIRDWCESPEERLALGANSISEVIFQFHVPPETLPGTYHYLLVIDAPQHYPEDTPIRYAQKLQVFPAIEEAVTVADPTFILLPVTTSVQPAVLQPGQILQLSIRVNNRSDKVDRFWLTCPDLEPNWFTVRYPEGVQERGLVLAGNGLDLNPDESGEITVLLNPPLNALAGNYFPTIRLHSANNPNLILLDVFYLEVLPVYVINVELRTLVGKVRRMAGLYEVRLNNLGNTPRQIILQAIILDEDEELCIFTFPESELITGEEINAPPRPWFAFLPFVSPPVTNPEARTLVRISPSEVATIPLEVKPNKWFRRPWFGGGLLINFGVELEDVQQLPITNNLPQGTLIWQPRPWWQLLLVILTTLGSLAALAFLIWWFFFRPPAQPKIADFASVSPVYKEANNDFIRLNWQIRNPNQISAIAVTGTSVDGSAVGESKTYNFSQGIPNELKYFCAIRTQLVCQNVLTNARQPGDYVFELKVFSKKAKDAVVDTVKTNPIKIQPVESPKIVEFFSSRPTYEEATFVTPDKIPTLGTLPPPKTQTTTLETGILLNWKIANPEQLKEIRLIGRSPDGSVTSPLRLYAFNQGIPENLKPFCRFDPALRCTNIPTGTRKPGDYIFELSTIPKKGEGLPSSTLKTDPIKIQPIELPKIVEFSSAQPSYLETSIILNWKIANPEQLKEIRLIGRSPDGSVTSPLTIYTFSQGIPENLKPFCQFEPALKCTNVTTETRKPGNYIFELSAIPKKGEGLPSSTLKTDTIKITPLPIPKIPIRIITFNINNAPATNKYVVPLNPKEPPKSLKISWQVEGGKDLKVELLPSPGIVLPKGEIYYPISQQPIREVITLKASNGAGQEISKSVTIETFNPPPPPPPPIKTSPSPPGSVPSLGQPVPGKPAPAPNPPAPSSALPAKPPLPATSGRPTPTASPAATALPDKPTLPATSGRPTPTASPTATALPAKPPLPATSGRPTPSPGATPGQSTLIVPVPPPPGTTAPPSPGTITPPPRTTTPSPRTTTPSPGTTAPPPATTASPPPPTEVSPAPHAAPSSPSPQGSPSPSQPGSLSPSELPPRFD